MKSRLALLFLAVIGAVILSVGAGNGEQVDLEPFVPICGHISPSSTDNFSFSAEPGSSSISLLLRWRDADSGLRLSLRSPGGIEFNSTTSGDFKAEINSLSIVLPAPEVGIWLAKVSSGSLPAGGDDYCLSFKPASAKEQETPKARFNGLYRDYGVDEDGNGLYEYVVLMVGVNVKVPGTYSISGYISGADGGRNVAVESAGHLNIGSQFIELELRDMAMPGPYRLSGLALYDIDGKSVDKFSTEYTTHEYQDLETASAKLTGNYSDYGSDINGDGFYDYLTVDVGVEVYSPDNYSLMGFLCGPEGHDLVWSLGFAHLLPGVHIMHIDFDGKSLWQSNANGPYSLCNLTLFSGDSAENLSNEDAAKSPHLTKPYNYTQFVDPVWPKGAISGSGDGEILLTISIDRTLPVFQGRYSLDIVGVAMPPISSNWTMSGYEGSYVYDLPGVHMPGTPNNFTVTAAGAKNLNVGVRREFAGVGVDFTRAWVTAQAQAGDDGKAMVESDLISPGKYQFKIFGDAADDANNVTVKLEVVKRLVINGDFNLSINADGLPSGDYSISARALNGSLRLDRLDLQSPDIKF